MSQLFKKPKDMRWVDLAIWVDENFYKDDCDHNVAYSYIYLLASMLASKHKYFDNKKDYEEFAALLAYDTYKRMTNPNKTRIKSVLNYMKSIISFRHIGYSYQKRQKIIDPEYDRDWDALSYIDKCKSSYELSIGSDKLFEGVSQIFDEVPRYIDLSIPKVFKLNKQEYKNIYISCLLSMINRITLSNSHKEKFNIKYNRSPVFNEANYYNKYLDDDIILWQLSKDYTNLILVILNKTNNKLINEIKELSNEFKVSDEEFSNIMTSGFAGVKDETNN